MYKIAVKIKMKKGCTQNEVCLQNAAYLMRNVRHYCKMHYKRLLSYCPVGNLINFLYKGYMHLRPLIVKGSPLPLVPSPSVSFDVLPDWINHKSKR